MVIANPKVATAFLSDKLNFSLLKNILKSTAKVLADAPEPPLNGTLLMPEFINREATPNAKYFDNF